MPKFTKEQKQQKLFIGMARYFSRTDSGNHTPKTIGVSRATFYNWKNQWLDDPSTSVLSDEQSEIIHIIMAQRAELDEMEKRMATKRPAPLVPWWKRLFK